MGANLMKLKLGVNEVPEVEEGETTYTVGKKLEETYGIFSMFSNYRKDFIANALAEDAADGIAALIKGDTVDVGKVFAKSSENITDKLHEFITQQQVEEVASRYGEYGIPTQAALQGKTLRTVNGRNIKKPKKGQKFKEYYGARRPSFMYSGLFEHSLKAWIE